MKNSLLFLPDISGFTEFVHNTEVGHSQQIIAELLEVLIKANTLDLKLAEVEGDALFLYKDSEIPSLEMLLAQVETMYSAFYSHLKLLEKNRVCPCNACSSAHKLELKIIAHSGELQYISVQGKTKPFGIEVIQAHRLMKNSINSSNYILLSSHLANLIKLPNDYRSHLFHFNEGTDTYDGTNINYYFSNIEVKKLQLKPYSWAKKVTFNKPPAIHLKLDFPIDAKLLLEYITNYTYRNNWIEGVDRIDFSETEVTRVGSEHICVVNGKYLNFVTVTKDGKPDQLVYGELTTSPIIVDELYQFYLISPINNNSCKLEIEIYWNAKSPLKKLILALFVKNKFKKNTETNINSLLNFITKKVL